LEIVVCLLQILQNSTFSQHISLPWQGNHEM
jgi:hypothetical protein